MNRSQAALFFNTTAMAGLTCRSFAPSSFFGNAEKYLWLPLDGNRVTKFVIASPLFCEVLLQCF